MEAGNGTTWSDRDPVRSRTEARRGSSKPVAIASPSFTPWAVVPPIGMPVANLAREDAVTVERDAEATDISRTMNDEQVGAVVVVEGDEPVGIVTDRTLGLAIGQEDDPASLTAGDLMSGDPETIEADAEAYELAIQFGEAKVRRLPVVDEGGQLEGIVSLDDLIATNAEQLEEAAKVIEEQSPGYAPDER